MEVFEFPVLKVTRGSFIAAVLYEHVTGTLCEKLVKGRKIVEFNSEAVIRQVFDNISDFDMYRLAKRISDMVLDGFGYWKSISSIADEILKESGYEWGK